MSNDSVKVERLDLKTLNVRANARERVGVNALHLSVVPRPPASRRSTLPPRAPTLPTMKAITLSATFDGDRIRLEDDFPIPKNARLLVTVLPESADDEKAFRDFWRQIGAQSLSRAYGPNEPDYTLDMVREPNPEYENR